MVLFSGLLYAWRGIPALAFSWRSCLSVTSRPTTSLAGAPPCTLREGCMCRGVIRILFILGCILNGWLSSQGSGRSCPQEAAPCPDQRQDPTEKCGGGPGVALPSPSAAGGAGAEEAPHAIGAAQASGRAPCGGDVVAVWTVPPDGQAYGAVLPAVWCGQGQLYLGNNSGTMGQACAWWPRLGVAGVAKLAGGITTSSTPTLGKAARGQRCQRPQGQTEARPQGAQGQRQRGDSSCQAHSAQCGILAAAAIGCSSEHAFILGLQCGGSPAQFGAGAAPCPGCPCGGPGRYSERAATAPGTVQGREDKATARLCTSWSRSRSRPGRGSPKPGRTAPTSKRLGMGI